jgi:HK97 family phage major capsid protein
MNLEQLRALWAAAHQKCEDIRSKAATETRQYTADERTTLDVALAEMETIDADIKREETLQERAASAQQTRADQRTNRPGAASNLTTHDNAEDKPFANFGEQLIAIRDHALDRGHMDPRLRKFDVRDFKVRAAAGLNETVASDGGFLVGVDTQAAMEKTMFETGQILSRCRQIPITNGSNGTKIPYVNETSRANGSRWGGVQAYWMDEAASVTATKPNFGKIELGLKKLGCLIYVTDEQLSDAAQMNTYISEAAPDEMTFVLEDAIIRGPGSGTPLGILTAGGPKVKVTKETSQGTATILYANVSKMKQRMLPRSFAKAAWFVNIDAMPQLEQMFIPAKNVAGTENVGGFPAYLPAGGASGSPYGTLFGRPVIPIEQAETVGTEGDIMLLDLSMYLLATKGGIQAASSIHVNFLTDETAFRFIQRIDGQPGLKKAITPYKGAGTLSPFVTLETR